MKGFDRVAFCYDFLARLVFGNAIVSAQEYYLREIKDGDHGHTLLYSGDSIHQDSGAVIPLKIGPKYNVGNYNEIYLGYYDIHYGNKVYTMSGSGIRVQDTVINEVECPADESVNN